MNIVISILKPRLRTLWWQFQLQTTGRDANEGIELEGSKDGDEASDFDSKTSTEGTPVAPSTANDRDANKGIDIIDLVSEDDSDDVITTLKMTEAASAPQSTELSDDVITTPKMTGAVSAL